jgi:hypothetical protein
MIEILTFLVWIIIDIVIVLTILFLVLVSRILLADDFPDQIEKFDISTIRTGDIIGAAYRKTHGYFVRFWSSSIWSHIGVAWRDPVTNELFILEGAFYKNPNYKGVVKVPIKEWVRFNRKEYMGITRINFEGNKNVDPNRMIEFFKNLQTFKLDTFNWRWYRLLFKTPYNEDIQQHYTCYEISILLLQEMGIVSKKYKCSSYFPCDIMSGNIDLEPGCVADPIVFLDTIDYYRLIKTGT